MNMGLNGNVGVTGVIHTNNSKYDCKRVYTVYGNTQIIPNVSKANCDIINNISPFIKQMKYVSTGRGIVLYEGTNLKLTLSKGLPCADGVYTFCDDIFLILEVDSDYLPLNPKYDFKIEKILETVFIDEMYKAYLKLECNEYDFETYYKKIRDIIHAMYISLSADYVIETLLSNVKKLEEELSKLRKERDWLG